MDNNNKSSINTTHYFTILENLFHDPKEIISDKVKKPFKELYTPTIQAKTLIPFKQLEYGKNLCPCDLVIQVIIPFIIHKDAKGNK